MNLTRIDFGDQLLPQVQAFDCGNEPWQRELADALKAPRGTGGVLDGLDQGTRAWLYLDNDGNLVGYGSLGDSVQRWPGPKDPQIPVSIIPWLAVDRRFWGKPPGHPEQRYSTLILGDLISEARCKQDERPLLILFVHVDNVAALKLYERAGFREFHKPYTDKKTGWQYKRMVLVLREQTSQA
jgi:ribosomal protein S18 acetylase RimI-like enzyme